MMQREGDLLQRVKIIPDQTIMLIETATLMINPILASTKTTTIMLSTETTTIT